MGWNSRCRQPCIGDRISALPDAILCLVLSFLSTREAVKTSVLSHRWIDVWASVPNLSLTLTKRKEFERFAGFVDRVLFFRCLSSIHKFQLRCTGIWDDFSRIDPWIYTAVKRNVVELELDLDVDVTYEYEGYQLPRRLLMCNTLVVLKLTLNYNDIIIRQTSDCFPSLKFLHVTLHYPGCESLEKLLSCSPVLEDLIIEGDLEDSSVLNIKVSAPKLKRLRISLYIDPFGFDGDEDEVEDDKVLKYECQKIYISANAPNLEVVDLRENFLASYSLYNAKSLSKAKVDLEELHAFNDPDFVLDSAYRIKRLFAGICSVTYLSLSSPVSGDRFSQDPYHLPTFNNLNHLELHLPRCCSWQLLKKLLDISPNLEYLVIEIHKKYSEQHFESGLVYEWSPPDFVPICLLSRLKTICIRGFHWSPDEMEVAKYLLKHGAVLDMVTICTSASHAEKGVKLWQELSTFPKGSKTCQIEIPKIQF